MSEVPILRIRQLQDLPLNSAGDYILYWMTAFRRPFFNFALQRAIEHAKELQKPLLIFEALRCDYPFASERLHSFILQGMADNRDHFARGSVRYYPYVEPALGAGKGLLEQLAKDSCLVVTDDCPGFFYPRMLQAAAKKLRVRLEAVDSNGLLPLFAAEREFTTAYAFRRFLQKTLPRHLLDLPQPDPLAGAVLPILSELPAAITARWAEASAQLLDAEPAALNQLPIDHKVKATAEKGGWQVAQKYLQRFLSQRLPDYPLRSDPDRQVSSELSPYLHFGQISTHQIFRELAEHEGWSMGKLSPKTHGKRSDWWGMSPAAESFLDELVTWRELALNSSIYLENYSEYCSLPPWARLTLEQHRNEPRPVLYSFEALEQARTHDPLWNAAQNQLLHEGRIQNYLRMLWGKKILEWSPDAETALQTMLALNDKYALDGRDPNSISGIFWCLGRYDRAWGPERPIFGKIRYMSSENTRRKFSMKHYLAQHGHGRDG